MTTEHYTSIEAARLAGKDKGSLWAISFSVHERYLGHIFEIAAGLFMIVTQRGNLVFAPDEVKSVMWVDDVDVTWIEPTYWPADPCM